MPAHRFFGVWADFLPVRLAVPSGTAFFREIGGVFGPEMLIYRAKPAPNMVFSGLLLTLGGASR